MLADWQSADGRKAIEKMGEPAEALNSIQGGPTAEQQALALLRDRARVWLIEHNRDIERTRVKKEDNRGFWWVRAESGQAYGPFGNYDAALIAAILATEKAK